VAVRAQKRIYLLIYRVKIVTVTLRSAQKICSNCRTELLPSSAIVEMFIQLRLRVGCRRLWLQQRRGRSSMTAPQTAMRENGAWKRKMMNRDVEWETGRIRMVIFTR